MIRRPHRMTTKLVRTDGSVIAEYDVNVVLDAVMLAVAQGISLVGASLAGADLRGAYLSGIDLSGADLSGARLSGAGLSGADLTRTSLAKANLRCSSLYRARLAGADLRGADLSGALLSGAVLSGADLARASLVCADLIGADLSGASLAWADLSGVDLSGAYLAGVDLSRVRLVAADLTDIRDDLWSMLDASPHEVPALLAAHHEGRIDECCGLIGTLNAASTRKVDRRPRNATRPAEMWYRAIRPGHTPATSRFSALAVRWIEEWIADRYSEEAIP